MTRTGGSADSRKGSPNGPKLDIIHLGHHDHLRNDGLPGKVGIGTRTPKFRLAIADKDHTLNVNPHAAGVDLHSTGRLAHHYQTAFSICQGEIGTAEAHLTVDGAGNVGIGTAAPAARLEVNSGADARSAVVGAGTPGAADFVAVSSGNGRGSQHPYLAWNRLAALRLGTASTMAGQHFSEKLRVTPAGRVGIGNKDPREALHIGGAVRGAQAGALRISTGHGYVDVGPQGGSWSHFKTDKDGYLFDRGITVASGLVGSQGDLALQAEGTTHVTVKAVSGKVGIGTAAPKKTLDVNGDVRIAGSLRVGQHNHATRPTATVAGGEDNRADGYCSAVLGGKSNSATAEYSAAGGHRSKANHRGCFVWADDTDADFVSTDDNQFLIRAKVVGIGTNTPLPDVALDVNGDVHASGKLVIGDSIIYSGDSIRSTEGAIVFPGTNLEVLGDISAQALTVDGTIASSTGEVDLGDNALRTTAALHAGSGEAAITVGGAKITSSSGAIDFGASTLETTGKLRLGSHTLAASESGAALTLSAADGGRIETTSLAADLLETRTLQAQLIQGSGGLAFGRAGEADPDMVISKAGSLGIGVPYPSSDVRLEVSGTARAETMEATDHFAVTKGQYPRIESRAPGKPLYVGSTNPAGLVLVVAKKSFDDQANRLLSVKDDGSMSVSGTARAETMEARDHFAVTKGQYPRIESRVPGKPLYVGSTNPAGLVLVVAKKSFDDQANRLLSVEDDGSVSIAGSLTVGGEITLPRGSGLAWESGAALSSDSDGLSVRCRSGSPTASRPNPAIAVFEDSAGDTKARIRKDGMLVFHDHAVGIKSISESGAQIVTSAKGNTFQIHGGLLADGKPANIAAFVDGHGVRKIRIAPNGNMHLFGGDVELEAGQLSLDGGDIKLDGGDIKLSGGDIKLDGGDCAEWFPVLQADKIPVGTVLVADSSENLRPCSKAYDRSVVGVVSGAGSLRPGVLLGSGDGPGARLPVALAGRVYCRVDATSAPVEAGDLLTTSSSPGCAMRAGDSSRAFGAVIGKALAALKEGQGLVPILVALQ